MNENDAAVALVAMQTALEAAAPAAAELVACECVVLAETKDHANWELIKKCAEHAMGEQKKVLTAAADEAEDQEDEHLYHSKGWCRELWLQSLGLKAVLARKNSLSHHRASKASRWLAAPISPHIRPGSRAPRTL